MELKHSRNNEGKFPDVNTLWHWEIPIHAKPTKQANKQTQTNRGVYPYKLHYTCQSKGFFYYI